MNSDKKRFYLLAGIFPVLLLIFSLFLLNVYPFSNISFRMVDSLTQHPSFYEYIKHFKMFSFNTGLISNNYANLVSYVFSPLNILYFFFDKTKFDLFYLIILILKVFLAGLNFNIFLNYKKEYNKSSIIFSTIYAFSGYLGLNFVNLHYLDAVYILPLIFVGLQKLVFERNRTMYFITLVYSIISYFYLGYVCCIFSLVYFIFLLINNNVKNKKKIIIDFSITSLLAGISSLVIILPVFEILKQGRTNQFNFKVLFKFNEFAPIFFYNLTSGNQMEASIMSDIFPSFMTMFSYVYIILIFFNKKYNLKYKLSVAGILLFFYLSVSFNFFYLGFHIFQFPNGYLGRFMFGFIALVLILAYDSFINRESIKINKWYFISIILFLILIIIGYIVKSIQFNYESIIIFKNIILLSVNILIFIYYLFFYKKKFNLLTIFLILFELILGFTSSFMIIKQYQVYDTNIDDYYDDIKKIEKQINKIDDYSFYRINYSLIGHLNNGYVFDKPSNNIYTSYYNINTINFFNAFFNPILYMPIENSLNTFFSNKYFFNNDNKLQINNYTVESPAFMVYKNAPYKDYLELFSNISNESITLLLVEPSKIYDKSSDLEEYDIEVLDYKIKKDYLFTQLINKSSKFFIDNEYVSILELNLNGKNIEYCNEVHKGDILKLTIAVPKDLKNKINLKNFFLTGYDYNEYLNILEDLKSNRLTDLKIDNWGFSGNINVDKNKNILLFALPYSSDYVIKVNGEKVKYYNIYNGLVGIDLNEGNYKIEFHYTKKYFIIGLVVTIISILNFIIYNYVMSKKVKYENS